VEGDGLSAHNQSKHAWQDASVGMHCCFYSCMHAALLIDLASDMGLLLGKEERETEG
jgi:hypothetical protein